MEGFRRRLPSMTSLVVFEAVARRLSFTKAAAELNVTQAAVSRQIHGLEQELGFALFRRLHRRVELTERGRGPLRRSVALLQPHRPDDRHRPGAE